MCAGGYKITFIVPGEEHTIIHPWAKDPLPEPFKSGSLDRMR